MNETIHISHFCIIRRNLVVVDHDVLYKDESSSISEFLKKAYKHFKISYAKYYKMDNLCKLGFLTSELLVNNRDLGRQYGREKTGIILANASSSLDTDRNYQESITDRNNYFPSPSVFVYTLPNIVMGEICIRHHLKGENTFFIQEQFNPGFIHHYIKQLFDNEIVTCCIAGWVEMDGDQYEAAFYLVEKTSKLNGGIAIFDVDNIEKIYCMNF